MNMKSMLDKPTINQEFVMQKKKKNIKTFCKINKLLKDWYYNRIVISIKIHVKLVITH